MAPVINHQAREALFKPDLSIPKVSDVIAPSSPSLQFLETVIQHTESGIMIADEKGYLLLNNEKALELIGISKTTYTSSQWRWLGNCSFFCVETQMNLPFEETDLWQILLSKIGGSCEFGIQIGTSSLYLSAKIVPHTENQLSQTYQIIYIKDISKEHQLLRQLERQKSLNQALETAIPHTLCRINKNGYFVDYQSSKITKNALPSALFLDNTLANVFPNAIVIEAELKLKEALATQTAQSFTYHHVSATTAHLYEICFSPIDYREAIVIIKDVSDLTYAKEALDKGEAYYETLLDNLPAGVVLLNQQGQFLKVNTTAQELLELPDRILPPDLSLFKLTGTNTDKSNLQRYVKMAFSQRWEEQIEAITLVTPKRNQIHVLPNFTIVQYRNQLVAQVELQAVPPKKLPKKVKTKLAVPSPSIFEVLKDGVAVIDLGRYKCLDCNKKLFKILGCESKETFLATSFWSFSTELQADGKSSNEKLKEIKAKMRPCKTLQINWRYKRLDGSEMDSQVILIPFSDKNTDLWLAILRPKKAVELISH